LRVPVDLVGAAFGAGAFLGAAGFLAAGFLAGFAAGAGSTGAGCASTTGAGAASTAGVSTLYGTGAASAGAGVASLVPNSFFSNPSILISLGIYLAVNTRMAFKFIQNFIVEGKKDKLVQLSLPYSRTDLESVMSKETIDYHFASLYKAYVDRYNKGEGDRDFNEAGAFLHNIYFNQFQSPSSSNNPNGAILELIEDKFKSFEAFKEEFAKVAMAIQGSGWVYLAKNGTIKTIVNHQIKEDIVLLVDWWEHAWALDYQADKKKYLENQWKIINWEVINGVLGQGN
jgi:Fe-Mn family superoxide dismutase